uniref:Thaumatin-like protein n=1 Tax=Kalanchoe fedtschenkoi TaxID=63787 RepID=A0A7N0TPQ4_KALFE
MAQMLGKSLSLLFLALLPVNGVFGAVFTLQNHCSFTVWPGTLTGSGAAISDSSLALAPGASAKLQAPPTWSGRIWARTGCKFDAAGTGSCSTGDCPGGIQCTGGGQPPVTLAEFTLGSTTSSNDFYDVSLVDGYNVGMRIKTAGGGTGDCRSAGCVADLNKSCPKELQVVAGGSVVACKSACEAFNTAEYCCTGEHSTPQTCPPTRYSEVFKAACPTAYSYAYDDLTSTRTCAGSDYLITFCPTRS